MSMGRWVESDVILHFTRAYLTYLIDARNDQHLAAWWVNVIARNKARWGETCNVLKASLYMYLKVHTTLGILHGR